MTLYRLQRAAQIATATERGVTEVIPALVQFRKQVPGLKTMRDVGEHFDDYALDHHKRHRKEIDRTQLEVAGSTPRVSFGSGMSSTPRRRRGLLRSSSAPSETYTESARSGMGDLPKSSLFAWPR